MRTIHSERYWRLRCLRPAKANFRPRSTASLAERYSFDLVRKYPLARSNIFLRLARRLVPRFTRGMVFSFFLSLYGGWRQENLSGLFTRLEPGVRGQRSGVRNPWMRFPDPWPLAPGPCFSLVRNHPQYLGQIPVAYQPTVAQLALALGVLRRQDVAQVRMPALHLPGCSFLEALGSAFVRFQFRHRVLKSSRQLSAVSCQFFVSVPASMLQRTAQNRFVIPSAARNLLFFSAWRASTMRAWPPALAPCSGRVRSGPQALASLSPLSSVVPLSSAPESRAVCSPPAAGGTPPYSALPRP